MASYMESIPRPTKTYHTNPYPRLSQDHGFEGAGKTVLVTGGAGGVGLAISRAFAEAGASRLVIVARSAGPQAQVKAELEASHPGLEVLTYAASITDRDSTAKILKDLGESGGLDVLVLCAAVAHRRITAAEVSPQEVRDAFEINTIAAFDWTQTYLSSASPKAKTVINVSAAAAQMRHPMRAAYGPSKAAEVQIMQAFAAEVDWKQKSQPVEEKTRIFSFHPGSLYTPGVAEHFAQDALEWDDVNLPAHFARWLAGPHSDFLHGRYLWAHWDVEELMAAKERLAANPEALTIGLIQL
ncbi:lactose permease [Apiospora arundinis]